MKEKKVSELDDIDIMACSTMDCTGLIPSLPQTEEELENYNQLYPFEPEAKG